MALLSAAIFLSSGGLSFANGFVKFDSKGIVSNVQRLIRYGP